MKKSSTSFLKVVILIIGIAIFAVCIFVLPEMVRRDVVAHPDSTYLSYLFLIYAYLLCIPFYFALNQAFKLLTYINTKKAFSELSVKALSNIKYCAIAIVVLIIIGVIALISIFYGSGEDITGLIMLSLIGTFASSVIATFSAILQGLMQEAINIKSENDLTI